MYNFKVISLLQNQQFYHKQQSIISVKKSTIAIKFIVCNRFLKNMFHVIV